VVAELLSELARCQPVAAAELEATIPECKRENEYTMLPGVNAIGRLPDDAAALLLGPT
jgi:hypothetical protein